MRDTLPFTGVRSEESLFSFAEIFPTGTLATEDSGLAAVAPALIPHALPEVEKEVVEGCAEGLWVTDCPTICGWLGGKVEPTDGVDDDFSTQADVEADRPEDEMAVAVGLKFLEIITSSLERRARPRDCKISLISLSGSLMSS